MMRILRAFGIAIIFLLLATPVLATDDPDSAPTISNVHANVYLIEEGDVLIYGEYNIPYATLPDDNAALTYIFTLIDSDNNTMGAITPFPYAAFDNGYNEGAFGFYFSSADNLTVEQEYTIHINQNPTYFDSPESWSYAVPLSAWTDATNQDDNQTELTLNIISIAESLEVSHDATLLESSVGGTVLSDPYGETYFRGAIYGIQAMAPELFLVQSLTWDTTDTDWDTTEFDSYGTRFSGTFIGTATDDFSEAIGLDTPTFMGIFFALPIILAVIIISSIKWHKAEPGYMASALILILVALMGWVEMALFATIYQLLAIYIGYLWFYARSSGSLDSKMFSFLAFSWLISTVICLIVEGSWLGADTRTVVNDLSAFTTLKIGGLVPIPAPNLYFFRGLFRMLTWEYSFYTGMFEFMRWVFLAVFSGAAIWGLAEKFATIFANFLRIR